MCLHACLWLDWLNLHLLDKCFSYLLLYTNHITLQLAHTADLDNPVKVVIMSLLVRLRCPGIIGISFACLFVVNYYMRKIDLRHISPSKLGHMLPSSSFHFPPKLFCLLDYFTIYIRKRLVSCTVASVSSLLKTKYNLCKLLRVLSTKLSACTFAICRQLFRWRAKWKPASDKPQHYLFTCEGRDRWLDSTDKPQHLFFSKVHWTCFHLNTKP